MQVSRLEIKMDSLEFSDLVKEIRRQLSLSQEGLARKLDVSFSTINRWENGRSSPSKLAQKQFDAFVVKMKKKGLLDIT